MTPYSSISGKKSGVTAYEINTESITVDFSGRKYTYPVYLNGENTINHMKSLALASNGLSSFIARNRSTLKTI